MQVLSRIEVHGKNMFYFFGTGPETVVLRVHFGMSGAFKTLSRRAALCCLIRLPLMLSACACPPSL